MGKEFGDVPMSKKKQKYLKDCRVWSTSFITSL